MKPAHWADREPDEDVRDWLLRLMISYGAIAAHARRRELEVTQP